MKLYVKNVKSCMVCPACTIGPRQWFCDIALRPIRDTTEANHGPAVTVMPWCPLENVKKEKPLEIELGKPTMKIKKKLRIINCTTCGVEIQTYNVHQKYCNACREAKKNEQKIKRQIRKAAKREKQKESEQPLDPGRENRVLGLIKKYEAIEATLLKHKIKPQSAEAYEVDTLININT